MNDNQRPDSGILFRNRNKQSDKHPDFSGDITIGCEHCGSQSTRPLRGWIHVARTGAKFLTLSCRPKPTNSEVPF
jgi:hypothetical protein